MDRIEAVGQAFYTAYEGYMRALESIRRQRRNQGKPGVFFPDGKEAMTILAAMAPVAAEIYRQLTGRLLVEVGSERRPVGVDTLERVRKQLERAGVEPELVAAQDIKFRDLDNETIIRIIVEAPGGEVTEAKLDDSQELYRGYVLDMREGQGGYRCLVLDPESGEVLYQTSPHSERVKARAIAMHTIDEYSRENPIGKEDCYGGEEQ